MRVAKRTHSGSIRRCSIRKSIICRPFSPTVSLTNFKNKQNFLNQADTTLDQRAVVVGFYPVILLCADFSNLPFFEDLFFHAKRTFCTLILFSALSVCACVCRCRHFCECSWRTMCNFILCFQHICRVQFHGQFDNKSLSFAILNDCNATYTLSDRCN